MVDALDDDDGTPKEEREECGEHNAVRVIKTVGA